MQKYGTNPFMDKLVNSDDCNIRKRAIEQDYGLDKLINDKDWRVRNAIFKSGYWKDFCADNWEILIQSKYNDVREAIAKQGYGLDILINDEDERVREAVAEQGYGLDKLINDNHGWVRARVAEQGYGLDILINDTHESVRRAVAEQGYGLDKLINDNIAFVRAEVARQGYGLDILINDKDDDVRQAVAEQGYGLDILINDDASLVRSAVVRQGYGLDKLINDEDATISIEVLDYLKDHNYATILDWAKANPDKVYSNIDVIIEDLKDFIYKIDDSFKLEVQSEYDNIDDFFIDHELNTLVICTTDTKLPIIKIEKCIIDQNISFKFIVDITNEDRDNFSIKTTIKSKEHLYEKLQETIESLRVHKEFSKYIDDLENCL